MPIIARPIIKYDQKQTQNTNCNRGQDLAHDELKYYRNLYIFRLAFCMDSVYMTYYIIKYNYLIVVTLAYRYPTLTYPNIFVNMELYVCSTFSFG